MSTVVLNPEFLEEPVDGDSIAEIPAEIGQMMMNQLPLCTDEPSAD